MNRENVPGSWQRVGSIVTIVILVAALRLGKDLLVPFALAALLSFLLAPIVHGLERLRLHRVPAVVVTVFLASAGILALGWLVWGQMNELAKTLPQYRETIQQKIASAARGVGDMPLRKIEEVAEDAAPPPQPPPPPGRLPGTGDRLLGRVENPQLVEIVPARPSLFQSLRAALGPYAAPLGAAGIVFVLAVFMLLYHEDLRDRMIRLVSRGQIVVTTQALAEASQKTSRYLLTTLVVNALYGIPIGIGLYLLGVPNALLWGLLATLLRFIPYLGPWIAASFPILLSVAVFPDWSGTAKVVLLFVVVEIISNNVVEPWLYGKRTGLSPMAVIVAAIFWSWLWGIVGLLLAVPLTLLLAVVGRHVPPLRFLHVLLGDEPGLGPSERFYQRLVAHDPDEAVKVAEAALDKASPEAFYDEIVLPALRAAKADVAEGRLGDRDMEAIRENAVAVLDDLAERRKHPSRANGNGERAGAPPAGMGRVEAAATPEPGPASPSAYRGVRVLFLPASDATDALAGRMLALALRPDGMDVRVLSGMALSGEAVEMAARDGADVVCIGGFPPSAVLRARHLCKRLRADVPGVRLLVASWEAPEAATRAEERLATTGADRVATTVAKAADGVRVLAGEVLAARPAPGQSPARTSAK
jgi:predicted PurR-regulated permease PerM/methylmalonyl-CoA mutase cobalamin-binding subunit